MKIPQTSIEVDDFRPVDASLHALTHYHADHRRGLQRGDQRPILCSTLTRRLLVGLHGIPPRSCQTLDPGQSVALSDSIRVTAFDANHCPGALMLLFEIEGRRHLHTGDFRYAAEHDAQAELFDDIDTLFLDHTYWSQQDEWEHPPQDRAIEEILELIRSHPRRTVYLGVYTIGKNRIVQAIHRELGLKVALTARYHKVYELLGMSDCVTLDRRSTRVFGFAMGYFQRAFQMHYPRYEKDGIVILPTGWKEGRGSGLNYHYVPYSEHCSSSELRRFVEKVAPKKVVDTNDFF